ncbi:hypothetical protein [Caldimonas brevitalea]|uniref:Ubiquinone biosynthesis protein UbiJ n=1 Tax=Caldimonas brevitalea TaxID=413882 RepID=A0A0G3BKP9_9BURK|nr:hypothetical protein [Caldimonas brevitalea]AKJ27936.1 ubiquinone biosynthesis protein UbiJ [Caldimonas brevitalea]
MSLQGVSPLLHWPEFLAFRITPAGLLEVVDAPAGTEGDLHLGIDLSQPGRLVESLLTGRRPSVSIRGDSQLATDVGWLMDNLRWDYEDDLARVVGPVVAHQAARVIRATSGAVRQALGTLARWVPGRGDADTDASARRPS